MSAPFEAAVLWYDLPQRMNPSIQVRELTWADAAAFQRLRLEGLRECPLAFASSYEEELDRPLDLVGERLDATDMNFVLGAFNNQQMVGLTGLYRERHIKMKHRGTIWGVYVAPQARRGGIARLLMLEAIERATTLPGLMQLNLGVHIENKPAIALYESLGFKAYATEPGYLLVDGVLHDELLMSRWLRGTR